MQKFIEAPYLELENYKAPIGANFIFIPMQDNKSIVMIGRQDDANAGSHGVYQECEGSPAPPFASAGGAGLESGLADHFGK